MPYPLPDNVKKGLEKTEATLESCFDRVWGSLSPSVERDEIMLHILQAKKKLNDILKEEQNNG